MKKRRKKKMSSLDKYLIFCFTVILLYIIAHTVIFALTGQEATTLTISTFGCFAGELILCALLKKFKLAEEYKMLKGKKDEIDDSVDEE